MHSSLFGHTLIHTIRMCTHSFIHTFDPQRLNSFCVHLFSILKSGVVCLVTWCTFCIGSCKKHIDSWSIACCRWPGGSLSRSDLCRMSDNVVVPPAHVVTLSWSTVGGGG